LPVNKMPQIRKYYTRFFALLTAMLLCNLSLFAAPDGKALFQSNCASCHNPLKDATGPALKGIDKTFPSKEWGYKWVHNSQALVLAGDKDAVAIFTKYAKVPMTAFPQLSNEDIDAILKYVDEYAPPAAPAESGNNAAQPAADSSWLYVYITIALAILVIIMWRVNQSLNRAANDREGIPNVQEIPWYRHKAMVAIGGILIFILAGYWLVNGAINEGRQQNYQPLQPIFYSHRVHAGVNQVNCLYCHSSAEKSRHAMIPSTNVCMNCHKQINAYSGQEKDPLMTAEGKKIDGTKEIQKLYEYAGWDPVAKAYKRDAKGNIMAKPIEWVKIHNLPDHVYFNHSQHVNVGKVQCQKCHGPIQEMDEVYQFAPLSMGWCINCHRQTQVQFEDNNYYSNFERFHKEMKEGKRTKVTEAEMGGLECQKCHY
jgi:mono/diheme cytochrome c family protein